MSKMIIRLSDEMREKLRQMSDVDVTTEEFRIRRNFHHLELPQEEYKPLWHSLLAAQIDARQVSKLGDFNLPSTDELLYLASVAQISPKELRYSFNAILNSGSMASEMYEDWMAHRNMLAAFSQQLADIGMESDEMENTTDRSDQDERQLQRFLKIMNASVNGSLDVGISSGAVRRTLWNMTNRNKPLIQIAQERWSAQKGLINGVGLNSESHYPIWFVQYAAETDRRLGVVCCNEQGFSSVRYGMQLARTVCEGSVMSELPADANIENYPLDIIALFRGKNGDVRQARIIEEAFDYDADWRS